MQKRTGASDQAIYAFPVHQWLIKFLQLTFYTEFFSVCVHELNISRINTVLQNWASLHFFVNSGWMFWAKENAKYRAWLRSGVAIFLYTILVPEDMCKEKWSGKVWLWFYTSVYGRWTEWVGAERGYADLARNQNCLAEVITFKLQDSFYVNVSGMYWTQHIENT